MYIIVHIIVLSSFHNHIISYHITYKYIYIYESYMYIIAMNHITSYHIISHHITSYHIISHHITSYHIISHHITSYHIISHHITSYHIISHHITSYHITCSKSLNSHSGTHAMPPVVHRGTARCRVCSLMRPVSASTICSCFVSRSMRSTCHEISSGKGGCNQHLGFMMM